MGQARLVTGKVIQDFLQYKLQHILRLCKIWQQVKMAKLKFYNIGHFRKTPRLSGLPFQPIETTPSDPWDYPLRLLGLALQTLGANPSDSRDYTLRKTPLDS